MSIQFSAKRTEQGFSLMEVLISMIVIAIGLLGFMALQLSSINSNQEGMARAQANLIVQDFASKLRTNRDYIFDNEGNSVYLNNANYNSCTASAPFACGGSTANCTSAQQARFDVWTVCRTLQGFTADSQVDDPLLNPRLQVGCTSRDGVAGNCKAGSTLSTYLYWAVTGRREDVGYKDFEGNNEVSGNVRCTAYAAAQNIDLAAIGSEVDCVILDLMP